MRSAVLGLLFGVLWVAIDWVVGAMVGLPSPHWPIAAPVALSFGYGHRIGSADNA
jgi:hypothetical protein